MRLVLWDIDGTLVRTAGDGGNAGSDAFFDAFERVVGYRPQELAEMAGRTDHEIALATLELHGVEDPEAVWPDFSTALAEALAAREDQMRSQGRALPGAHDAITALGEADGVVQSLLTGNIEPNARTKLEAFGLGEGLDFEIGAYGSDDRHRPTLVSIARRRAAEKLGAEPGPEDIVLIGDTPRDVDAARANGTRVLGVATGRFPAEELAGAGAETVLTDLSDTAAVVDAVLAVSELSR
jgi:phosphoglycolate phosphatase-like HAD superfamily hydrolase